MFDGRWREKVDRRTGPVGRRLVRLGVTADVLTAMGLGFAIATAVAVGSGHLLLGIPLLTLTGFTDLLDGPVAKASGTASARGAFFDSVTDRVSDAVIMIGVAWYLVSADKGHLAVLPLAILAVTSLISYERSKAEALGLAVARGGLMERAERMILLGVGFLAPWLLVPVLWVLFSLSVATAAGRFARVWKAAEGPPRRTIPEPVPMVTPRWWQTRTDARRRSTRHDAAESEEPFARWRARRQEAAVARRSRRQARQSSDRHPGRAARFSERSSRTQRRTRDDLGD
jgi:CDP-diacylglycerol---glycerol-3-phosphate 3-phosphatidyltransferase